MAAEQDLTQVIDERIRDRGAQAYLERNRLPDPVPPAPGTWEHDLMVKHEQRRQERIAAARAAETAQLAEREAEEERRRAEWEANAPARAEAQRELDEVDAELERVNADRDRLLDRRADLAEQASC